MQLRTLRLWHYRTSQHAAKKSLNTRAGMDKQEFWRQVNQFHGEAVAALNAHVTGSVEDDATASPTWVALKADNETMPFEITAKD